MDEINPTGFPRNIKHKDLMIQKGSKIFLIHWFSKLPLINSVGHKLAFFITQYKFNRKHVGRAITIL